MKNKTYDFLKRLVQVILPAILTFIGVVMSTLDFKYTEIVLTIGTAFITMLGTILGISNSKYIAKQDEVIPEEWIGSEEE